LFNFAKSIERIASSLSLDDTMEKSSLNFSIVLTSKYIITRGGEKVNGLDLVDLLQGSKIGLYEFFARRRLVKNFNQNARKTYPPHKPTKAKNFSPNWEGVPCLSPRGVSPYFILKYSAEYL
jgi:hypothetical protein